MNKVHEALRKRYDHLHPLIFTRSVEKAQSDGELFDILESVPQEYPITWDDDQRRWVHTDDLLQAKSIKENQ
jgi:hypothetical protein